LYYSLVKMKSFIAYGTQPPVMMVHYQLLVLAPVTVLQMKHLKMLLTKIVLLNIVVMVLVITFLVLFSVGQILTAMWFLTANSLPARDPMIVSIEGSNQPSSVLLFGSSWTLIYRGSSDIDSDPNRYSYGMTEIISNNIIIIVLLSLRKAISLMLFNIVK
jgi:hypothetical protein